MLRTCLLLAVFARLSLSSLAQDSTALERARRLEQRGIQTLTEGDAQTALSLFEEMRSNTPLSSRPYYWIGLCQQALNRHLQAAWAFEVSLWYDSTNYLARYQHARSSRLLRLFNNALESYKSTIKLKPDFILPYMELGQTYLERKNYDEAIPWFEEVITRDSTNALSHFYLAQCYLGKSVKDSAEKSLLRSSALDSLNYNTFFTLGAFYYQNQRYEEGISSFKRANSIDYWSPEVYHKLGDGYAKAGDYRKAIVNYSKAFQLGDSTVQTFSALGSSFFSVQAYDSAIVYFGKAVAKDLLDPLVHYNLAVGLSRRERHREAVTEFERSIRLGNTEFIANTHVQVGINWYHLKQYRRARESYRKALMISPRYPVALYNMAVLYDAGLKDRISAKTYYERFISAAKNDSTQEELVRIAVKRIEGLKSHKSAR